MNILYQVVDHCDLNCAGCDHGSPLAKPWTVDVDQFESDLCVLAAKVTVNEVILYGGEPLLHPQLPRLMTIARTTCPTARLYIKTNGLRFRQWMTNKAFRTTLLVTGTRLEITEYPPTAGLTARVNAEYPGLADQAATIDGEQSGVKQLMFRTKLHQPGDPWPSAETAHTHCYLRCQTAGLRVRAGKAYPCPLAMCAPVVFIDMLPGVQDAGVDIAKATTDQLLAASTGPCAFCAWCGGVDHGVQWSVSTRRAWEWLASTVKDEG